MDGRDILSKAYRLPFTNMSKNPIIVRFVNRGRLEEVYRKRKNLLAKAKLWNDTSFSSYTGARGITRKVHYRKLLAMTCNFGNDSLVRDRIICGIEDRQLR